MEPTPSPLNPAHVGAQGPRRGVSLIEIMVVVVILAIGIEAAFGAIISASRTSDRAATRNKALASIQNQIEILQALDRTALDALFTTSDTMYFPVVGLSPQVDASGRAADQAGQVTRISRSDGASVRTCLRFTVAYRDGGGDDAVQIFYYHAPRR